jgi:hypothetical protein
MLERKSKLQVAFVPRALQAATKAPEPTNGQPSQAKMSNDQFRAMLLGKKT